MKMNNFGIYMGGPVVIPKVYNGHNKTFFFGSYEVLRLPKSQTAVESVPTEAIRNGDLSAEMQAYFADFEGIWAVDLARVLTNTGAD